MHGTRKASSPSEVTIRKAANGGYIVRQSYDNSSSGPSYTPSTELAFSSRGSMMRHVRGAMGGSVATPDQKPAPTRAAGHKAAHMRGAGVD